MDLIEPEYRNLIARDGFAVVRGVVDAPVLAELRGAIDGLEERSEVRRRRGTYGVRNLLGVVPAVRRLAACAALRALVEPVLGRDCFAVRGTFFDKIPEANWKLPWHQDSVIAVRERLEVVGFEPWSEKAGVWQVQPPAEVLAGMLALRVHLDDCTADNGPLRVLPGSHGHGWLDDEIDDWKQRVAEVHCEVPAGGVLAIRPLILHASSAAQSPNHRRVIHLEYAAGELPGGLQWHERVGP